MWSFDIVPRGAAKSRAEEQKESQRDDEHSRHATGNQGLEESNFIVDSDVTGTRGAGGCCGTEAKVCNFLRNTRTWNSKAARTQTRCDPKRKVPKASRGGWSTAIWLVASGELFLVFSRITCRQRKKDITQKSLIDESLMRPGKKNAHTGLPLGV